jgi:hypothetical protein
MPYIKQADRVKFEFFMDSLPSPQTAGELNYLITRISKQYLEANGSRYEQLNAVVGALECAKMECYRRIISPYEDIKIEENGDV